VACFAQQAGNITLVQLYGAHDPQARSKRAFPIAGDKNSPCSATKFYCFMDWIYDFNFSGEIRTWREAQSWKNPTESRTLIHTNVFKMKKRILRSAQIVSFYGECSQMDELNSH
jgi:hypothetical protein